MDAEFIKQQVLAAQTIAYAGLTSGQEIGRMESAAEIKRLRALIDEALDLVPRMSADDPIAPALAQWCGKARAA